MRISLISSGVILTLVLSGCVGKSNLQYVDPMIGTRVWQDDVAVAGHESPSGFTFPGVTVPFGMTEWTPHTLERRAPIHKNTNRVPYWYDHPYISGFIGTHYPSGAVMYDYGAVELMPLTGSLRYRLEERASSYSHDSEVSSPDCYSVYLDDYDVKVEMTALHSTSVMRFTFPQSDSSKVIVDAMPVPFTAGVPSEIIIDPEKSEIRGKSAMSARGYRQSGYFVVKFDRKFDDFGTFNLNTTYPEVIEEKYLFTTDEQGRRVNGLTAVYTQKSPVYGDLKQTRIDPVIDFNWDWYKPGDDFEFTDFQSCWTGILVPPVTGEYIMGLQSDDGSRLYIDGNLVVDNWESRDFTYEPRQSGIYLEAGREYDIRVEHFQGQGGAKMKLSWIIPDKMSVEEVLRGNAYLSNSSKTGAFVNFKTAKGETVEAVVGTSFISMEQAEANILAEIGNKGFDAVRKENARTWEKELSRIDIESESEADKTVFYTAMYHSMLLPRSIAEHGRYRSPFDGKVYEGESFTDYSLWDTFRAVHPLLVLLKPDLSARLITGLLNAYDEGGWIPKWPNPGYTNCMQGTHGDSVIADAYVKGVTDFDTDKAKAAMLKNAYQKGDYMYWGRLGIMEYIKHGYVPIDFCLESAARTLEFSYDDYCIAQFLDAKGDHSEAAELRRRSDNFKNLLDPETGLVRGRKMDGSWADPNDYGISIWCGYSPQGVLNYKKNYTLFVPHNVPALTDFLGGKDSLSILLDDLFDNNIYYVGDEFVMHAPYMYNACGKPWKTQERVRTITEKYYLPEPNGLPGNDDCGQLSAWYIFSALGFYPMCPGSDEYEIGSPLFSKAVINLENGKKIVIEAENQSEENIYIQRIELNGKPYHSAFIRHRDLADGAHLTFVMGNKPAYDWFKQ